MLGQGLGQRILFRHHPFLSLILLGFFLSSARPVQSESSAPLLLELTDPALITQVWEIVHPDSVPPPGDYRILFNPDSLAMPAGQQEEDVVCLIRNGTETGRMSWTDWEAAAASCQKGRSVGWRYMEDGAELQEVPLLWKTVHFNRETLLAWTEWPASVLVGISTSISALPSTQPQLQRNLDFAWSQKLYRHYVLGLEIHRDQFGGGITQNQTASAFWGNAYWAWSLSAGIPGLKYTVALANQPLPEFFWLETRATTAITTHKPGRVVTQWTGTSLEKSGNLAHTADARLGYLRYAVHFDKDAYHMAIHTVSLDEMPALFGTWGTGIVIASSQMATRVWFDIPDLALTLPHPQAYPTNFRIAFLRLDLAYRSLRNFNLGVAVRLRIQNSILNLPGA